MVRSHFQSLADDDLAFSPIIATRASLCELLAVKLLRHFTGSQLELVAVLTHAWNPLQSAPASVVDVVKADLGRDAEGLDDPMNALEVGSEIFFVHCLCIFKLEMPIGRHFYGIKKVLLLSAGAEHHEQHMARPRCLQRDVLPCIGSG